MATIRCRVQFHGYDGVPTLIPVPLTQIATVLALKKHIKQLSSVPFLRKDVLLWSGAYVLPDKAPLVGLIQDMDVLT
jgi:hypothetical protein